MPGPKQTICLFLYWEVDSSLAHADKLSGPYFCNESILNMYIYIHIYIINNHIWYVETLFDTIHLI